MAKKQPRKKNNESKNKIKKVRYAVIGLGAIAQNAVLPAFKNAAKNSSLVALISGDGEKLNKLGKKYKVENLFSYDQYEECLVSGLIDAVYIALPNVHHRDSVIKAARAGVHVLCEKPLAVTVSECEEMIDACRSNNVEMMTAYRLHFDPMNLEVLKIIDSGKIGEPVFFSSNFALQVKEDNIRTKLRMGGGALYDIGIYCINAARTMFHAEPQKVFGVISNPDDERFEEVDGLTSVIMEFGAGRVANFTCSFAASDTASYEIVGTKGSIKVENAYEYAEKTSYRLKIGSKVKTKSFKQHDQFAAELIKFSNLILEGGENVSSGVEGLADIRVIQKIYDSCDQGRMLQLKQRAKQDDPHLERDSMSLKKVAKQKLINAESPSK